MAQTLLLAVTIAVTVALKDGANKPNVLFIVADDLGYNDVGWHDHGDSLSLTPNLNKLARAGVRLNNHHVQPFCSPTRATIQTGRHVLRYGLQNTVIWPQDAWAVPKNETFISQNMHDAGYATAAYGKWHLGLYQDWALPMQRGYDEQYGYYLGGEDYFTHDRNGGVDWHRNDTLELGDNNTYSAYLLGNASVDFINRKQDEAWFLYLAFQSVHSPLQVPDTYLERFPKLSGNVLLRNAMVAALDDQVGFVVDELKRTNQYENTVIVFTSDNGAPYSLAYSMGDEKEMIQAMNFGSNLQDRPPSGQHGKGGGSNYPLSGWKHWVFEGGVRSAAFVSYSKLNNPGSIHNGLFHSVDWLPTLVNLVGGQTSKNLPLDGADIWSYIQSGSGSPHRELPIEIAACGKNTSQTIVDGPQAAIIVGDMKLIVDCWWRESKNASTAQLYNLTTDISEEHDLSTAQPETVKSLLARLDYWESVSVEPYAMDAIDQACGEGKPQGTPPHWDVWC